MEDEMKKKEIKKLKKKFDDAFEEEYEEAKYKKPPLTVLAYQKIYGELPDGHPQKEL